MKLSNAQLADIRPGDRITVAFTATYEEMCRHLSCTTGHMEGSAVALVDGLRYAIPEGADVALIAPVPAQRGAWE